MDKTKAVNNASFCFSANMLKILLLTETLLIRCRKNLQDVQANEKLNL